MINSAEPKIVFWTEAGQGIGMGHLCRSLVIARELLKFGQPSLFIINNDTTAKDRLNAEGFPFEPSRLSDDKLPLVLSKAPKTIVFDTKKDITSLIQRLKHPGHKIILLDNTTPARFGADIAIYPSALYNDNLEWSGFKGHVYGGAQYVPVAETYMEARGECQRLRHQPPYHILVTMGGSDPRRLTSEIVASLRCLSEHIDIRVVIAPAFMPDPCLDELEQGNAPRLQFIRNQNDLSSLMADSHMAVTAVGITLYELAAVGVPAIVIANYTEDRRDMELYKKLGMNLPLGFYQDILPSHIREATSQLIQDSATWQSMRNKGWQLIDGCGARRIVECVLENA
jgi:spore coat polysaccharide biosynthesis predicted glycosyltransferase SpsG